MPISMSCSGCGRSFQLKDEMAGRKVRCPECEAVQVVPAPGKEEVRLRAGHRKRHRSASPRLQPRPLSAQAEVDDDQREVRRLG